MTIFMISSTQHQEGQKKLDSIYLPVSKIFFEQYNDEHYTC